jgi:hypothetical protein
MRQFFECFKTATAVVLRCTDAIRVIEWYRNLTLGFSGLKLSYKTSVNFSNPIHQHGIGKISQD